MISHYIPACLLVIQLVRILHEFGNDCPLNIGIVVSLSVTYMYKEDVMTLSSRDWPFEIYFMPALY